MVDRFAEMARETGACVHVCASLEEAQRRASELIAGATVARWQDTELEPVEGASAAPEDADVSLIAADVGVADTGQVGFAHGPGRPRGTGVLPPRQIVLLDAARIVQSLQEALSAWFADGLPPGNVVLAAGPSRTADIEQRMVLGAHGPREFEVVIYR